MNIGVLGGTFNPVHLGHVNLAKAAISKLSLDKLLIVPTGRVWYKEETKGASSEDRLNMLELAFETFPEVEIIDIEVRGLVSGYTFETIPYLKENYFEGDYFYIFGQDCLRDFNSWKNPQLICNSASIVYAKRQGVKDLAVDESDELADCLSRQYNSAFLPLEIEVTSISSSEIRNRISANLDVTAMLPAAVSDYIIEKGLYK